MSLLRTIQCLWLLVLFVGVAPAMAQDDPGDEEEPLLRGSNRALSFSLDGLNLASLDGGVGARWYIGQRTVLRTTLRLSVESTESVTQDEIDSGRSAFGAGTSFHVEWHTESFRRVSPYVAAGVGIQFDVFSETTDFAGTGSLVRSRDKGTAIDFFVDAGVGVEVYLSRSISLSGEHLVAASVRSLDGEVIRTFSDAPESVTKRDATSFLFGTGTSRLILSVFF